MKIPKLFRENLLLKMTSLNAVVIGIRLVVSLFIQRLSCRISRRRRVFLRLDNLRNFTVIINFSTTTGGIFNGVTKYVSEYKNDQVTVTKNVFYCLRFYSSIGISYYFYPYYFFSMRAFLSTYLFGYCRF